MMRGYNASNNPSDYQEARWSHPGFDDSQVDTSAPPEEGKEEDGEPYSIWTMKITISAEDAGKKWVTCEWQQGDFPLSTDFTFLIFKKLVSNNNNTTNNNHTTADNNDNNDKKLECTPTEAETIILSYGLGEEQLDEQDMTQQIEDDIKRQISDHYSMPASSVSRSEDGQQFLITVNQTQVCCFIVPPNMNILHSIPVQCQ